MTDLAGYAIAISLTIGLWLAGREIGQGIQYGLYSASRNLTDAARLREQKSRTCVHSVLAHECAVCTHKRAEA